MDENANVELDDVVGHAFVVAQDARIAFLENDIERLVELYGVLQYRAGGTSGATKALYEVSAEFLRTLLRGTPGAVTALERFVTLEPEAARRMLPPDGLPDAEVSDTLRLELRELVRAAVVIRTSDRAPYRWIIRQNLRKLASDLVKCQEGGE